MPNSEKHLFVALALSALAMLVNIIAVTTGVADGYYSQLSSWLINI